MRQVRAGSTVDRHSPMEGEASAGRSWEPSGMKYLWWEPQHKNSFWILRKFLSLVFLDLTEVFVASFFGSYGSVCR